MDNKRTGVLARLFEDKNNLWLGAVSAVIFALVCAVNAEIFLSTVNLKSFGMQFAEFGFFALAMMISFLSGGIDISIVSVANLTGVTVGFMFAAVETAGMGANSGPFILLAFVIALIMGTAAGALNGWLIAKFNIAPLLVTLGTMNLYMGTAVIVTKAKTIIGFPEAVPEFANGNLGAITVPLVLFAVVAAVVCAVLNKTKFGMELRFYGTNPKTSWYSGIKNKNVVIKAYVMSAVISAVAGAIMVMRVNSARANFGATYMFTSVLCVILGGISPMGGKGKMSGVVRAAFTLQLLSNGFNMMGITNVLKDFIWGILLLGVMSLNFFSERRRLKRKAS
jgi:simple sugar transport system permease protein